MALVVWRRARAVARRDCNCAKVVGDDFTNISRFIPNTIAEKLKKMRVYVLYSTVDLSDQRYHNPGIRISERKRDVQRSTSNIEMFAQSKN